MTEAEIIRRESPEMKALIAGLASVAEQMSEVAATHRPLFGGDVYLTGREVTERLFISRRTLQEYRDRGLLPYTRIEGAPVAFFFIPFHSAVALRCGRFSDPDT